MGHLSLRTLLTALLVTFALSIPLVAAAGSFSAVLTPQKDVIYQDEVAFFSLTLTNQQNLSDTFTVSTQEFDWILDTTGSTANLAPGENRTVIVELSPNSNVPLGARVIRVKIRSANTKDFDSESVLVSVRSINGSGRTYSPSVLLNARVNDRVDPRDPFTVSVYLRNRNARSYDSLTVRMTSDLFVKEYNTTLGPITGDDGEKTNQVSVLLDPLTPPGNHTLSVAIIVDNASVNSYDTSFLVIPYDVVDRASHTESSWFKYVSSYTLANKGNEPRTVTVLHPTSFFARLFTTTSVAMDVAEDGGALQASVTLAPTQQVEITVTENYRLISVLVLIVVISIISYFVFRSPVLLHKEASLRGSSHDGVSEMRIRLHIKNRSARAIHNLHVVDKVTAMADVLKESSLGTLQPTKVVKKKGAGTLVRWDLDVLEAFEERIITYTVRTELKLIGDVYLPAVKVKYDQRGRERTTYSNEVNIPREG